MSGADLIKAAIANRAKRLEQVAALQPAKCEAEAKAEDYRQTSKGVGRIAERAKLVQSLHYVPGFYPTPPALVALLIQAAQLSGCMRILEPEAGLGHIAHPLASAGHLVSCVEKVPQLVEKLREGGLKVQCADFLTLTLADFQLAEHAGGFDRVIMSPPFEHSADVDHVRHAWKVLRPGGRLVAIMSEGSFFRSDRKATEFREFLSIYGTATKLSPNAFNGAGHTRQTGVNTRLVVIDR